MRCQLCGRDRQDGGGCGTLTLNCLGIAGWIGAAIVFAVFLLDYIKK